MKRLAVIFTALCLFSTPVWADYYDGLRAFDRGDYATAKTEWSNAAQKGNAEAQHGLAMLFEKGLGVLQDFAKAHALYNLASANGSTKARKARDALATKMTPQELGEARAMAKSWPSWLGGSASASAGHVSKTPEAQGVERFNGLWTWHALKGDAMCTVVFGPPAEVKNGKYRVNVSHGSDSSLTSVAGTIAKDGTVKGYGSGSYVYVDVQGKAEGNKAKGRADVGGEASCIVEWVAERIKP